jgi:hypothetical protein
MLKTNQTYGFKVQIKNGKEGNVNLLNPENKLRRWRLVARSRRQEAGGRRQEAGGRRQEAGGRRSWGQGGE